MDKETLLKLGPEGRQLLVYVLKVLTQAEASDSLTEDARMTFFDTVEECARNKGSFGRVTYQ